MAEKFLSDLKKEYPDTDTEKGDNDDEEAPLCRYQFTIWDYSIWLLGVAFLLLALFIPAYQICYLFGFGVLSTLLIRSIIIRGLAIAFDIAGFLVIIGMILVFGDLPPSITSVMFLVFSFDILTLFPLVASTIAIFSVVIVSAVVVKWDRFIRLQLLISIIALFLATINALISVSYLLTYTWVDFILYVLAYSGLFLLSYCLIYAIGYAGIALFKYGWGKLKITETELKHLEEMANV